MRIGIGLPAAVPGTDATELGEWAERSERLGFESLGVLDRLVYDNLDPLVALAAAAARTERAELVTAILGVPYRGNAVVVGKQLASVHQISGGRLVAERYFSLGDGADAIADAYLMHYYGPDYFPPARADTLRSVAAMDAEIGRLAEAGVDDLILFPCSGELEQVELLAEALDATSAALVRAR